LDVLTAKPCSETPIRQPPTTLWFNIGSCLIGFVLHFEIGTLGRRSGSFGNLRLPAMELAIHLWLGWKFRLNPDGQAGIFNIESIVSTSYIVYRVGQG
jgi:hypothetical protein